MKRLVAVLVVTMCCGSAAAERKPNVILLVAGDLGYSDVSFNGRREWQTPNLHRLALDGTIFRRWYAASTDSAASQAALLTGKYRGGVNEDALAPTLKNAGYALPDQNDTDHAIELIKQHKATPVFIYLYFAANQLPPPEDIAAMQQKFPDEANAKYAARIVDLDRQVGRILKQLDQLDLNRDTIVIFTSDHGAPQHGPPLYFDSNRPFRGGAGTLWEGGIRVPAAVRWTGKIPSRTDSHEVVYACDIFPSVLAAAGVNIDPAWKIDGQNLLEVWTGKAKAPARIITWTIEAPGYAQSAAMRGDLKLVITGNNSPELFDVETDPVERRSLAADAQNDVNDLKSALSRPASNPTTSTAAPINH